MEPETGMKHEWKPHISTRDYPYVRVEYSAQGRRFTRTLLFEPFSQSALGAVRHVLKHLDVVCEHGTPPLMLSDREFTV